MGRTMHRTRGTRVGFFGYAAVFLLAVVRVGDAESPLADAAEANDVAAIRSQLGSNFDVNQSQADGMTALHWAVYHDDQKAVALLIDAGADATVRQSIWHDAPFDCL